MKSSKNCIRLVFFLLLITMSSVFEITVAQVPPLEPMQEVSGNSPNAGQLKNALEVVPNYYKGQVNLNIPIYELVEKELKLPVSLSYNSVGIRPDEPVSWVGLSWNLFAGGTITRNVNGLVDERIQKGYIMAAGFNSGSLLVDNSAFDNLTTNFAQNQAAKNYFNKVWLQGVDYAPDEFNVNIQGRSVKFYIGRDGNVISNSKIRFEYELTPYSGSYVDISSWTLTFEDGTRYIFGQTEVTRTLTNVNSRYSSDSRAVTGWHLTKIESSDRKNKIDLIYDISNTTPPLGWSRPYRSEQVFDILSDPLSPSQSKQYEFFILDVMPKPAILQSIETSTQSLRFVTEASGINNSKVVLKRIEIFDKSISGYLNKRKSFQFTINRYGADKMLLKELREGDASGNHSLPPYRFYYDERNIQNTFDLDHNNNTIGGVDHWGYYNGSQQVNTYRTSRLPYPHPLYDGSTYQQVGISRNPNATYSSIGLLTSVFYPAGGSEGFEYENNYYSSVGNQSIGYNVLAGGARIKKITTADGGYNQVIRSFSYTSAANVNLSSGVIMNEPIYKYQQSGYTPNNEYFSVAYTTERPINSVDLGYSSVTEIFQDGSKTVYNYKTTIDYPYESNPGDKSIAISTKVTDTYFKLLDHPFKNEYGRYHYMLGLPATTIMYNSDGTKASETIFEYAAKESPFLQSFRTIGMHLSYGSPYMLSLAQAYSVNCGKAELIKKTIKNFNADQSFIQQTKEYTYNQLNDQVQQERTINSKGEIIDVLFTYPLDHDDNLINGSIYQLKNRNIISPIITKRSIMNGSLLTDASVNYYNQYGQPKEVFVFNSQVGLPISSIPITYQQITINNYLKKKISYIYNSLTNLLEQVTYDDKIKVAYLRNSRGYVIAEIRNASPVEVFYDNFDVPYYSYYGTGHTGSGIITSDDAGQYYSPYFPLPNTRKYTLSWFFADSGFFQYREIPFVPYESSIEMFSYAVDDVCIFPSDAQVKIYGYNSDNHLITTKVENGVTTYYEYDGYQRLVRIKDHSNNIIKNFDYHFKP